MLLLNEEDSNDEKGKHNISLAHAPQLSEISLIKIYILLTMAVFSLIGNLLTIWNICKLRQHRHQPNSSSAVYILIFHLSIADILVTGFCIIGEAVWHYTVQWIANEFTCKLVKLMQMFCLYLSTYLLVLIGIDRWIAVKYPIKSLNRSQRSQHILIGIYLLSFLLSLPQFFIFHLARGPFIEEFYQCVTHGFYTAKWQEQFYASFTMMFTFILPLCILFVTCVSTFATISKSERIFMDVMIEQSQQLRTSSGQGRRSSSLHGNRQRIIQKAKMRSLQISLVIIVSFLVCWIPYNIMMITFMFWQPDEKVAEALQTIIFFFGMSNSLVNPVIYGFFHISTARKRARRPSTRGLNSFMRFTFCGERRQRNSSCLLTTTTTNTSLQSSIKIQFTESLNGRGCASDATRTINLL